MRNLISHFIDCNCQANSVPGGGPAELGANAARWDEDIQRAFYNGWKSIHGLKHQTVDNAYGFTEDIYGPETLRYNDLTLLRLSKVNARFDDILNDHADQYCIFGDSAYVKLSHLLSYYKRSTEELEAYLVGWNKSMKHVRISIEWNYMVTGSLFKYTNCKDKLKILANDRVSKIYTVATLFKNFHGALYGCQSSRYFNLEVPDDMLEKYIKQTDF